MKKFIAALLLTVILSSCVVVPRPNYGVYSTGRCYPVRPYVTPPFFPFGYGWLWW